jgi:hypothetical protein
VTDADEKNLRPLLSDDEFAEWSDAAYRKAGQPRNEMAAKRIWAKMESNLSVDRPHGARTAFRWKWAAGIAVAAGLTALVFNTVPQPGDDLRLKGPNEPPQSVELALIIDGAFVPERRWAGNPASQIEFEVEVLSDETVVIFGQLEGSDQLFEEVETNPAIGQTSTTMLKLDIDPQESSTKVRYCALRRTASEDKSQLIERTKQHWRTLPPNSCVEIWH